MAENNIINSQKQSLQITNPTMPAFNTWEALKILVPSLIIAPFIANIIDRMAEAINMNPQEQAILGNLPVVTLFASTILATTSFWNAEEYDNTQIMGDNDSPEV